RELRYQQQPATEVAQRAVHLPRFVRKNPVAEQALEQAVGLRRGIAALDADEDQQPRANGADGFAADHDLCLSHALQQPDHYLPSWSGLDIVRKCLHSLSGSPDSPSGKAVALCEPRLLYGRERSAMDSDTKNKNMCAGGHRDG